MRALRMLVLALLAASVAAQWQQVHSQGWSTAELGPMVYDSARQSIVRCAPVDTQAFDGTTWTRIAGPAPQGLAAYDEARSVIVVHDSFARQTWELGGNNIWTQVVTATQPTSVVTYPGRMVYHAAAGCCVLHGGFNLVNWQFSLGETWHYDGSNWTLRSRGLGRDSFLFFYDEHRREAVALMGASGYSRGQLDSVDSYDGSNWHPHGTGPLSGYFVGAAAFDSARGLAVAVNTYPSATHLEVVGTNATVRPGMQVPPGAAGMAYDRRRNRTVLVAPSGTFELIPEAGARAFGQPCTGSNYMGASLLVTRLPVLGQSLGLRLSGMPAQSTTFLELGWSDAASALGSLPQSLTPFGLTGCEQLVSIDAFLLVVNVAGVADWSTAVPNQTVLLGTRLFAQGAHLVAGANPAGALMSGGQALVLGR